jgi:hypothetical protein
MDGLQLVCLDGIPDSNRTTCDPYGEPIQREFWYWADRYWESEPFYYVRSGPVSPLTFVP